MKDWNLVMEWAKGIECRITFVLFDDSLNVHELTRRVQKDLAGGTKRSNTLVPTKDGKLSVIEMQSQKFKNLVDGNPFIQDALATDDFLEFRDYRMVRYSNKLLDMITEA
jgi:hypothetical protein